MWIVADAGESAGSAANLNVVARIIGVGPTFFQISTPPDQSCRAGSRPAIWPVDHDTRLNRLIASDEVISFYRQLTPLRVKAAGAVSARCQRPRTPNVTVAPGVMVALYGRLPAVTAVACCCTVAFQALSTCWSPG
jgi:hypothetical protein